jgi:hypothetical protein
MTVSVEIKRPSTELKAYDLYEFIQKRIFGWTVVLGMNGADKTDGRTKQRKVADRLFREAYLNCPHPDECVQRLLSGEDPETLWPEEQQDFVRFCLWHRVPREMNEPLSEVTFEHRPSDVRVWPDFLLQYNKSARVEDMPPPFPPSDDYRAETTRRIA